MEKVALITGVTRGLGETIAEALEEKGYRIAGCGSKLKSVQNAKSKHPNWDIQPVNLLSKKEIQEWANYLLSTYSTQIEVLINNAGTFIRKNILEEENPEYLLSLNLLGAYHLTRSLLPIMIEKKSGTVINIISIAAFTHYPGSIAYNMSKSALFSFSESLRAEVRKHGIKVVSLLPGAFYSSSWEGSDIPRERLMKPEDIAKMITTVLELSSQTMVEQIIMRPQLGDLPLDE